ncbi:MAG: class I SAM-dependent RNA methyltransferase [Treponema sp.]|nr:class I SAM-dependent RNA methyltransferase [Treponema sp.]
MARVTTEKMVAGGDCIAKIDGKTVFIPHAVPGETLEIEITSSKRDYDTAKIVAVIAASAHRVQPACSYYGVCGGCNMMHIDARFQRTMRTSILADCFVRAGVAAQTIRVLHGNDLGYRARFSLHDGGLSGKNSNTIVPVERCVCATDEVNAWLAATPHAKRQHGTLHVFGDSRVMPRADCADKTTARVVAAADGDEQVSCVNSDAASVTIQLCGKKIAFDVRGFFQSNMDMLEKSLGVICGNFHGKNVLDMYAGCGTFSCFLADAFEHVTLVERNKDALVFASLNMRGKNYTSYGISGNAWAARFSAERAFDVAVVDPPRSGMEKTVRDFLCASNIPHIVSVSCNPSTHARDVAALVNSGYTLVSLFLLDFYPNTSHIESVAILKKISFTDV